MRFRQSRWPDYGQRVPDIVRGLVAIGGGVGIGVGAASYSRLRQRPHCGVAAGTLALAGMGALSLGVAGLLPCPSRVARVRERDDLLDRIPWRGDERVLDVGCGRGLLLIAAAKRLATGTATGVDLWNDELLSGNEAQAVWFNVAAEGVPASRIRLATGDARCLPFADASFEVVLSSLMLHDLSKAEREQALREMVRVLAPRGHLGLLDTFFRVGESAAVLRAGGLADVRISASHSPTHRTLTASSATPIPIQQVTASAASERG